MNKTKQNKYLYNKNKTSNCNLYDPTVRLENWEPSFKKQPPSFFNVVTEYLDAYRDAKEGRSSDVMKNYENCGGICFNDLVGDIEKALNENGEPLQYYSHPKEKPKYFAMKMLYNFTTDDDLALGVGIVPLVEATDMERVLPYNGVCVSGHYLVTAAQTEEMAAKMMMGLCHTIFEKVLPQIVEALKAA